VFQFRNTISYQQAYRVKEVVLQELWGDELECFAQFPDYIDRFKSADLQNRAYLDIGSDNRFNAAFFALARLRHAGRLSTFTWIHSY
jgi:hypothetical protein